MSPESPIIKVLREGLVGNRINYLYGILNGTCNYILTRMEKEGVIFRVLEDAQRLGYAEAEPSLDVDGFDAMHKARPLGSLAHGFWIPPDQIHVEGIRKITPLDIQFANQLGYTIKLLATIRPTPKKECKFLYAPRSSLCSTFWREFEMFSMPSTLVVMWLGKPSIMVEERGRMLPPVLL